MVGGDLFALTVLKQLKRTKIMPTIPHVELRDYLAKQSKQKVSAKKSKKADHQPSSKRTKIMPTIPKMREDAAAFRAKQFKKKVSSPFPDYPGYESLISVLNMALNQAAAGKGKERHAQGQPFEDQPMQRISQLLDSAEGMRYQIMKKTQESARMEKDAAIRELLGAINYAAGTVIFLQNKE
jgi:hypothetical protein